MKREGQSTPTNGGDVAIAANLGGTHTSAQRTIRVLRFRAVRDGIQAATPRETLEKAYQVGWLNDEGAWLELLRARNETSHAYDEELAIRIRAKVRLRLPELATVLDTLRRRSHEL